MRCWRHSTRDALKPTADYDSLVLSLSQSDIRILAQSFKTGYPCHLSSRRSATRELQVMEGVGHNRCGVEIRASLCGRWIETNLLEDRTLGWGRSALGRCVSRFLFATVHPSSPALAAVQSHKSPWANRNLTGDHRRREFRKWSSWGAGG